MLLYKYYASGLRIIIIPVILKLIANDFIEQSLKSNQFINIPRLTSMQRKQN